MREFSRLRRLQIFLGMEKDAGRICQLAVEDEGEDVGVVLVMGGNLAALEFALLFGAAAERVALKDGMRGAHDRTSSRSMTMSARSSTVSTRSVSNSSKFGIAMPKRSSMRITVSMIVSESTPRSRT